MPPAFIVVNQLDLQTSLSTWCECDVPGFSIPMTLPPALTGWKCVCMLNRKYTDDKLYTTNLGVKITTLDFVMVLEMGIRIPIELHALQRVYNYILVVT